MTGRGQGGHVFVDGVCECGQKTTDDPERCTLERENAEPYSMHDPIEALADVLDVRVALDQVFERIDWSQVDGRWSDFTAGARLAVGIAIGLIGMESRDAVKARLKLFQDAIREHRFPASHQSHQSHPSHAMEDADGL